MESSRVLRYYPSVLKMALLVVGAAAFVAVGFWMLSISSARGDFSHVLLAYVGIGFFGLCGLVGLWQCLTRLFARQPWLVVDSHGVGCYMSRRLRATPWDQISDIAIYRQKAARGSSQYYFVLNARDEEAVYKGRTGRMTVAMFPSLRRAAGWVPLGMFFVFCTRAKRQDMLQRIRTAFAPELAHYRIAVDERERDL